MHRTACAGKSDDVARRVADVKRRYPSCAWGVDEWVAAFDDVSIAVDLLEGIRAGVARWRKNANAHIPMGLNNLNRDLDRRLGVRRAT